MQFDVSADAIPSMTDKTQVRIQTESTGESYGEIIKSSATIGGSTVINIAVGVVRTKVLAVLLGPAGFGLFGIYASIGNLARTLAGMGVNSSGVRQIAHAVGSNDIEQISRTATTLRRVSLLLGLIGTALLAVFARPIAKLSFGNEQNWLAITLLSFSVLFQLMSDGQSALLQGMRRILHLASGNALGVVFGSLTSIILVYFFREKGIVPSIVSVAFLTFLLTWWYSRKIDVPSVAMNVAQIRSETASLLKLGLAFMASAFTSSGMEYIVRIIVLRRIGYEATGIYQAAFTLGGIYVGIILQAMGTDFYPRLAASANDDSTCNRLINEQTEVGLLLAGPGAIATLTLSPLVVAILYSAKFSAAVPVLRWMCLGTVLQIGTWPLSYMIAAKGKQTLYFACELALAVINVGMAWLCVRMYGLNGIGFAFFASSVLYGLILFPVASRLSGFKWSSANKYLGSALLLISSLNFAAFYVLPFYWATGIGVVIVCLSTFSSIRAVVRLVPWKSIPAPARKALVRLNLNPRDSTSL